MEPFTLPETNPELRQFKQLLLTWGLGLHHSIKTFILTDEDSYLEYHELVLNFQILMAAINECEQRIITNDLLHEMAEVLNQ